MLIGLLPILMLMRQQFMPPLSSDRLSTGRLTLRVTRHSIIQFAMPAVLHERSVQTAYSLSSEFCLSVKHRLRPVPVQLSHLQLRDALLGPPLSLLSLRCESFHSVM
jgi:hypothetical protein